MTENIIKKNFRLEGLDCANCAAKIEHAIGKLDGVKEATVNFMTGKLIIEGNINQMPEILEQAEKVAKKIEPGLVWKKA